jgi:hypothetical protein
MDQLLSYRQYIKFPDNAREFISITAKVSGNNGECKGTVEHRRRIW